MLFNENAITPQGYNITNSLRFQSANNSYLTRTFGVPTNQGIWTWSGWVKRGSLGVENVILHQGLQFAGDPYVIFKFNSSGQLITQISMGSGNNTDRTTTAVFRDPSAWYHIMLVIDYTQSGINQHKIYVNNTLMTYTTSGSGTAFTSTNVSLNQSAKVVNLGGQTSPYGNIFLDGHMTEVHFIDGQALTPASFGRTSPASGQWVARKYTGTYGTNGFYLPFDNVVNTSSNSLTYSEDFNNAIWNKGDSSTSSNVAVAPDGSTTADKLVENTANAFHYLYQPQTVSNVTQFGSVYVKAAERSRVALQFSNLVTAAAQVIIDLNTQTVTVGSSSADYTNISGGIITVGNGWYRVWIKATKGTVNTNNAFVVGIVNNSGASVYAGDGTSGLHIWGAQVETDGTLGYYRKTTTTTLSYVSNLFADKSLGKGSVNFWTPTNFSITAGVNDCRSIDVPSGNSGVSATQPSSNYPVMNPLNNNVLSAWNIAAFRGANLEVGDNGTNQNKVAVGTMAMGADKYYWEVTIGTGFASTSTFLGVTVESQASISKAVGIYYMNNGQKQINGSNSAYGSSYTAGDVIGFAYDGTTGTLTCYKNNVSQGAISTSLSGSNWIATMTADNAGAGVTYYNAFNFGQRSFAYTPPSGFKALCTANLPTPVVAKGNQHFDINTYVGDSNTPRSITNAGAFSPGLVWFKDRTSTFPHRLLDVVRGATIFLDSASTAAEGIGGQSLMSFDSTGFTVGNGTSVNGLGLSIAAWQWNAGSSTVTNTSGTISSEVRANPTAGVSVITYTGNGSTGTIGHGLGVAPKFVIVKHRSQSENWYCYHADIGNTKAILLNSTAAASGASINYWNNTSPTSSVISLGGTNASAFTFVTYAFAEIAGFSKISSYIGNGNPDGTFVYTGFRPKYIMIKRTDSTSDWVIKDTSRSLYNVSAQSLQANLTTAETATDELDILSNGFKLRHSAAGGNLNTSGGTYIYMAFAESPFNYSNAR